MTHESFDIASARNSLPRLPVWVTSQSGETQENVAFLSGASFAMLDMILRQERESIPKDLLANTLALTAAVATSKLEGRLAREADIRDAYHLTQPDVDGVRHWGPDGDLLDFWRRGVRLRFASRDWQAKLGELVGPSIGDEVSGRINRVIYDKRRVGPMAAAVNAVKDVLAINDRAERSACLLADIVLAKALGWDRPLPLTALHQSNATLRNLRKEGEVAYAAEMLIQNALLKSAQSVYRLAVNLSTRANALRSVTPKLRAKGSDDAIGVFLSEDAVSPAGMLSPHIKSTRTPMTDRAARRFCDRLVELGVARELTGRPTFRLYGIGA